MEFVLILALGIWVFITHMELRRIDRTLKEIKHEIDNTKSITRQILKG
jgi:hypothetical protein